MIHVEKSGLFKINIKKLVSNYNTIFKINNIENKGYVRRREIYQKITNKKIRRVRYRIMERVFYR